MPEVTSLNFRLKKTKTYKMKSIKTAKANAFALMFTLLFVACNNNSEMSEPSNSSGIESSSTPQQDESVKVEIPGIYSGADNVGMESTIILRSGGTLIIQASVGDGTPDYGNWTGTADNLSLYHKDAFGNDELIGRATVTNEGLRIIGGKFYSRQ